MLTMDGKGSLSFHKWLTRIIRLRDSSRDRCSLVMRIIIAEVMRDQFGIKLKVNNYSYRTPYPLAYDLILLPNRYKVQDFTKLSRQDYTSTMEHVNRFIIQCGEAAKSDELRVRVFSSSLSGSAFTWVISLPPNSVITWANLEKLNLTQPISAPPFADAVLSLSSRSPRVQIVVYTLGNRPFPPI